MKNNYDVLIIGGGPAGMYSSIIGSLINVSSIIVESNPFLGGQPMQLYGEKYIHDYPGFHEILTADLINGMINQIDNLEDKPKIYLNSTINEIKEENGIFISKLSSGETINTKFIIIATGSGNFFPIKSELLESNNYDNIHYIFHESQIYKNKKIVILGGGDSALDWANFLIDNEITNDVSLIHRREEFRAREEKIKKIMRNDIKKYIHHEIVDILEDYIVVISKESNNYKRIYYDYIIVQYGQRLKINDDADIFSRIERYENKKIKVDINCRTNIDNIYAIGNSNYYDSKPNLIITACSEGARAIYNIRNKKIKR